jgi:hypothetical protein
VSISPVLSGARVRAAAARAPRVYPNAVGEVLARELRGWDGAGRLISSPDTYRLMSRVIDDVLGKPLPNGVLR